MQLLQMYVLYIKYDLMVLAIYDVLPFRFFNAKEPSCFASR